MKYFTYIIHNTKHLIKVLKLVIQSCGPTRHTEMLHKNKGNCMNDPDVGVKKISYILS